MNTRDKEEQPIKVAIVSSSLSRNAGGILPIMQNHALELAQRGLEVSVHGLEDSFIDADTEGWGGLPIHLAPCHGPARLAFGPKLAESLAAVAPDIVHQHGIWQMTSATVSRWGRKTGRPIVVSAQGMLEPWALSHSRAKKRIMGALLERRNLSGASAIHVSRSEIAGVRAYVPGTPIAVLPNGAQPFDGPDPERPAFLPEDGRRTLLFLGRLHPKKGISETLKAWRKLKETNPALATQWRLAIVGWDDGGHAAAFEVEAKSLGLSDDVVFPGPVFGHEKDGTYRYADAFILASYSEGFPMAVMEAFSHELPVLMTRDCNIPEAFEANAAVEVTTDPDELSAVLARTLSLPQEQLSQMGQSGSRLVAEHFSWRAIAEDLERLYGYLLCRSQVRPEFLI